MKINVKKPEGNVFVILGAFQHLAEELEKAGADTTEHRALLKRAETMKYDEILDEIERISHGTITFTGRD